MNAQQEGGIVEDQGGTEPVRVEVRVDDFRFPVAKVGELQVGSGIFPVVIATPELNEVDSSRAMSFTVEDMQSIATGSFLKLLEYEAETDGFYHKKPSHTLLPDYHRTSATFLNAELPIYDDFSNTPGITSAVQKEAALIAAVERSEFGRITRENALIPVQNCHSQHMCGAYTTLTAIDKNTATPNGLLTRLNGQLGIYYSVNETNRLKNISSNLFFANQADGVSILLGENHVSEDYIHTDRGFKLTGFTADNPLVVLLTLSENTFKSVVQPIVELNQALGAYEVKLGATDERSGYVKQLQEAMLDTLKQNILAARDAHQRLDDAISLEQNQPYHQLQAIKQILDLDQKITEAKNEIQDLVGHEFSVATLQEQMINTIKAPQDGNIFSLAENHSYNELRVIKELFQMHADIDPYKKLLSAVDLDVQEKQKFELKGTQLVEAIVEAGKTQGFSSVESSRNYQHLQVMAKFSELELQAAQLLNKLSSSASRFPNLDQVKMTVERDRLSIISALSSDHSDPEVIKASDAYLNIKSAYQSLMNLSNAIELEAKLKKHTGLLRFEDESLAKTISGLLTQMFEALDSHQGNEAQFQTVYAKLLAINNALAPVFQLETGADQADTDSINAILKVCEAALISNNQVVAAQDLFANVMQRKETLVREITEAVFNDNDIDIKQQPAYKSLQVLYDDLDSLSTLLKNKDNDSPLLLDKIARNAEEVKDQKTRLVDQAVIELRDLELKLFKVNPLLISEHVDELKSIQIGLSSECRQAIVAFRGAATGSGMPEFNINDIPAFQKLKAMLANLIVLNQAKEQQRDINSALGISFGQKGDLKFLVENFVNESIGSLNSLVAQGDVGHINAHAEQLKDDFSVCIQQKDGLKLAMQTIGLLEKSPLARDKELGTALKSFLANRLEDVRAGNLTWNNLGKWIDDKKTDLQAVQADIPKQTGWRLAFVKIGMFLGNLIEIDTPANKFSRALASAESRMTDHCINKNIKTFQENVGSADKKEMIGQISVGLKKLHSDLSADVFEARNRAVNSGRIINASQIPELIQLKAMNKHLSIINSEAPAEKKEESFKALQTMIAERYQPNSFWSKLFGDKEIKQASVACANFIASKPFEAVVSAAPVAVARAEVPVSVSVAQEQAAAIEPVVDMPMSRQQDPAPLQVQELSAPAFQERLDSTQDLIVSTQRVVAGINAAASDQPPPIAAAFLTQTIINASQNMDAGAETASVPAVA